MSKAGQKIIDGLEEALEYAKFDSQLIDLANKYGDENWTFELREAVRDMVLNAVAGEREACAKIADENMNPGPLDAAQAIRNGRIT